MKKWEGEILNLGNLSKSFISLHDVPCFSPWTLEDSGVFKYQNISSCILIHVRRFSTQQTEAQVSYYYNT